MKSEDYKKELITILFAQKRIIAATTLVIFGCSLLIAFFWPPTYAAYGSVLVKVKKPMKSPEELERAQVSPSIVTKEDLTSEVEILTSHDVIKRTVSHLREKNIRLADEGTFSPLRLLGGFVTAVRHYFSDSPAGLSGKEVYRIKESLKTEVIPLSNIIEVTYYHSDPRYAVTFLNALLDQYVAYRMRVYYPEETREFFIEQAGGLSEQLEKKRRDWIEIIEKNRISDPLKEIENNLHVRKDLEGQLATLENAAIEKKVSIEYLNQALEKKGIQFFSFIDRIAISNLSASLQRLYSEYGGVLRTYKPSSDKARPVEKQLLEDLSVLRAEVQAYRDSLARELDGLNQKIVRTRTNIREITDRNVELQKQNINTQKIALEMELLKLSYETFAKRKEEAVSGASGPSSSYLSILSRAFPSNGPIFPKKRVVIPLGLVVGFITGCCFAFIREYFDHTFKRIGDVERHGGLPVLFSIPDMSETPARPMFRFGKPGRLAPAAVLIVCFLGAAVPAWHFFRLPPDVLRAFHGGVDGALSYVRTFLAAEFDAGSFEPSFDGKMTAPARPARPAGEGVQDDGRASENLRASLRILCDERIVFTRECYDVPPAAGSAATESPETVHPRDDTVRFANNLYEQRH
ncbi:MAG: GumC family protein [Alphaproteobacteria bacterium]|uniref:GumC family protein n=1 Tax=Candidatus Nitrobium versatile TaxID=2884831 RepID=A0A953J8G0_9BACT|nr:GumC family protein [Candidatus Nitrobium versatile]